MDTTDRSVCVSLCLLSLLLTAVGASRSVCVGCDVSALAVMALSAFSVRSACALYAMAVAVGISYDFTNHPTNLLKLI